MCSDRLIQMLFLGPQWPRWHLTRIWAFSGAGLGMVLRCAVPGALSQVCYLWALLLCSRQTVFVMIIFKMELMPNRNYSFLKKKILLCFSHHHLVPLCSPSPLNHRTVVHAHESFVFLLSPSTLNLPVPLSCHPALCLWVCPHFPC